MPTYLTFAQSGRTRLLRAAARSAVALTSLNDPELAARLARALDDFADDLPAGLVGDYEELTGTHIDDGEDAGWLEGPIHVGPIQLTRTLLNGYDASEPNSYRTNTVYMLAAIAEIVREQPPSVRRAVRDEIGYLIGGYDDVPVIARAYDYKWRDADRYFLVNTALATLTADEVAELLRSGDAEYLLNRLPVPIDETEIGRVWEAGYLRVEMHPLQLRAWLAVHHPQFADWDMPYGDN